ncbi:hypothetical protein T492DRAFT_1010647 [Pavlovales sp. CCMP2436]|nr:hypothetical protein T492DRAFT_1010647 [Pavlovales sp. CCMP2436]
MARKLAACLLTLAAVAVAGLLVGKFSRGFSVRMLALEIERANFPAHSLREIQQITGEPTGVSVRGSRLIAHYADVLRATMNASMLDEERTVVLVWDNLRVYGTWCAL